MKIITILRGSNFVLCELWKSSNWRDPTCNKCKKPLHQTNCKTKASDCKCHEINEQIWMKKKTSTA